MPLHVICSGCRAPLQLPEDAHGKHVRCPRCQQILQVMPPPPPPEPILVTPVTSVPVVRIQAPTVEPTHITPLAPSEHLGRKKLLLPLILGGGCASLFVLALAGAAVWLVLGWKPKDTGSSIVTAPPENERPGDPTPKPADPKPPDPPLTKAELLQLGKRVTALVRDRDQNSYGSAFCIHPSGLFVTNEHVVHHCLSTQKKRGLPKEFPDGPLQVIVNPGTPIQKVLSATVLRWDEDLDLALLQTEAEGGLRTVALGSDEKLTELTPVVAFGFPFGPALSIERGKYPEVTVTTGNVTALRRNDKELERIQVDVSLNPGNSGGAVLDASGKVVGVVVSAYRGSGISFLVPVSRLAQFLAPSEIQLLPPALERDTLHQSALFQARPIQLVPGKITGMDLILHDASGEERRVKMDLAEDTFRVQAVPIPQPKGPALIRAVVAYPDRTTRGCLEDRTIQVGSQSVALSEVRGLQFAPSMAFLRAEKTLTGTISGLDGIKLRASGSAFPLDLAKAATMRLEPVEYDRVRYTVVALRDGKEVKRQSGTVLVGDVARRTGPPPETLIQFRAPFDNLVAGGAGRYLILHVPTERKLAVFDALAQRVMALIPLMEGDIQYAASRDKLIVVYPATGVLQRWDLTTYKRDLQGTLPMKETVLALSMGAASDGPLLIHCTNPKGLGIETLLYLMELTELRVLGTRWIGDRPIGLSKMEHFHLRAAANGQVFGAWCSSLKSPEIETIVLNGDEARFHRSAASVRHVVPGPDGQIIYTRRGTFCNRGFPVGVDRNCVVPAHQGDYYLRLVAEKGGRDYQSAHVYVAGDPWPLFSVPNISLEEPLFQKPHDFSGDKHFHLIPSAGLLAVVPSNKQGLRLFRCDVDELLEDTDDYLIVTTQPSPVVRRGTTFSYHIRTLSRAGGVRYRLDHGPKEMTVSPEGLVRWPMRADYFGKGEDVRIIVTDGKGQKTFHEFRLVPVGELPSWD